MANHYHMDLEKFSIKKFRNIIQTSDLLPSEKILKEKITECFKKLESMKIKNLRILLDVLSTKKKIEIFSQESGLSIEYLTILRRRAGNYNPRPIQLKKMPGIKPEFIGYLASYGITNTKKLFEIGRSTKGRNEISELTGVPPGVVMEMVKLSDLARAPYVGPVYARIFYEAGVDTLEKITENSPEVLWARLRAVNDEQQLTKASLPSVKDMVPFLKIVKMIPKVLRN